MMNKFGTAAVALSLVLAPTFASAITVSGSSFALPDQVGGTDSVLVSIGEPDFRITNMEVELDLFHSFGGDLDIQLLSWNFETGVRTFTRLVEVPSGTAPFSQAYDGVYKFRADASQSIVQAAQSGATDPLPSGSYLPRDGLPVAGYLEGEWTLSIGDRFEQDDGFVRGWTLRFEDSVAPIPLPATLPLMLAGVLGFGLVRYGKTKGSN